MPSHRLQLILRLAHREVFNNKGFSLFFCLNLSLGLLGFVTIDAFKESIDSHLGERSKAMLTADVSVSARRTLTEAEEQLLIQAVPANGALTRQRTLFSMARSASQSRLVEVITVDEGYPFYGDLELRSQGKISSSSPKDLLHEPTAWVHPEVLIQLNLEIGELLHIGERGYRISDIVVSDPGTVSAGFMAAPKVYVGEKTLEATGLIQLGSRIRVQRLFRLPDDVRADDFANTLNKLLASPDLRINTHTSASQELNRALLIMNDYLGLVALVAIFLAGIGTAYLFRGFLRRRYRDVAIILSIGGGYSLARNVFLATLVILGVITTTLTVAFSYLLLPVIPRLLGDLVNSELAVSVNKETILVTLFLSIVGSLLLCLPVLSRLKALRPSELFRENFQPQINVSYRQLLGYVPALGAYWLLSVWQARSFLIGSLFFSLFVLSAIALVVMGWLWLRLLERLTRSDNFVWRMIGINLTRHKAASLACILCISLSAVLINVIPNLRLTLESELANPAGLELPSLFVFDVQDDQIESLSQALTTLDAPLDYLSPLIRARLDQVNGKDVLRSDPNEVEFSREGQWASRLRSRTYNLSYRDEFFSSETIIAGAPFSGHFDWTSEQDPEISLEQRFAKRLGLKLNDTMTFDIQGVAITGRVVSLRRIKWTSFQPNFFVQFQPGVLDDAPKSWLGGITGLNFDQKIAVQNQLVKDFPNVSVIDIEQTLTRIAGIINQVLVAITFMSFLSLAAGLAVVFSIASHQAHSRQRDHTLLKVLGGRFSIIRAIATGEFLLLGAFAGLVGGLVGVVVTGVITKVVFDGPLVFSLTIPLQNFALITALTGAIGLTMAMRTLQLKPINLLR